MSRRYSNNSEGHSSTDSTTSNQQRHHRRRMETAIRRQMASFQLPHMPFGETPTLRLLVVADIDLAGASALAEAALLPDTNNPLQRADLCIACGPFCRPDDLNTYYQGRQRNFRFNMPYQSNGISSNVGGKIQQPPTITSPYYKHNRRHISKRSPKRTREERAALEGLMTAALSQLESIVCRVLFIPGNTDPILQNNKKRLTPNSRNLHKHWMPLSPGLGCAGLLHLDWKKYKEDLDEGDEADEPTTHHQSLSLLEDNDLPDTKTYSEADHSGHSVDSSFETGPVSSSQSKSESKKYSHEFCDALKKLVQLAPPIASVTDAQGASHIASINSPQTTALFQSILVTNFHHFSEEQEEVEKRGRKAETPFDASLPAEHETFYNLPIVQEHVLLEIAAGRDRQGNIVSPKQVSKGKHVNLILPGSLKERGDYCLVDVAFVQTNAKSHRGFQWKVRQTQFLTL